MLPETLDALYAFYSMEDLAEVAKNHKMAFFSSLSKERLNTYMARELLDVTVMRRFMLYMTDKEIKAMRLAVNGMGSDEGDWAEFGYAAAGGYVGCRQNAGIVITEDAAETFRKMDTAAFETERKRKRLLLDYLNAAACLYGIAPLHVAQSQCRENEGTVFSLEEAREIAGEASPLKCFFALEGDRIIAPELMEDRMYETCLEIQGDISYYQPDPETLHFVGECNFLPYDRYLTAVHGYLQKLPGENAASAYSICQELGRQARFGNRLDGVPDLWVQAGLFIPPEEKQALQEMLRGIWRHSRMMIYRGHTPLEAAAAGREVEGIKKEDLPPETDEKIVSFAARRRLRIYPNDPCPCGSGKRYRECCGRK